MKAKRSLGQNFFINENLSKRIVETILKDKPDFIVEIGPGKGAFTHKLYGKVENLILIEKDNTLAKELERTFPKSLVINQDFLELDLENLEVDISQNIVFFGSLPYNVSKPIIEKVLKSNLYKNNCYFIIQKEVAEKYVNKEPNNNLLSTRASIFSEPKKLFDISPGSFRPKPNVTSSFVKFQPKSPEINKKNIEKFEEFLFDAFRQPRKKLHNNLKHRKIEKTEEIKELLEKRPQHLAFKDFLKIFNNL